MTAFYWIMWSSAFLAFLRAVSVDIRDDYVNGETSDVVVDVVVGVFFALILVLLAAVIVLWG